MDKSPSLKPSFAAHPALSPQIKGYIAMAAVLFIWSGFALSVRAINGSPLTPADVALFRFAVPLLILLPLIPSRLRLIRQIPAKDLLLVLLGGVPFFFLASFGAKETPAAYVGTILAGTPPFFVAILSWALLNRKISKARSLALSLILAGILAMLGDYYGNLPDELATAILFLLCGSFIWALYTIGLSRTHLDAISVTILISSCSLLFTLVLIGTETVSSNWGVFTLEQAMPFIAVQGVCVGLLATILYSYAVGKLGSGCASTIGSLSPGLTTLLAVPLFHETLSIMIVCGVSLTIVGVVLSNRH